MAAINFRLSDDLKTEAQAEAEAQGTTLNGLLICALRTYLDQRHNTEARHRAVIRERAAEHD